MSTTTLSTFSEVLARFNKLVENSPSPAKIMTELEELKGIALSRGEFTFRQTAAIVERVNNYIKGDYGNTKKEEHYGHTKPEKK